MGISLVPISYSGVSIVKENTFYIENTFYSPHLIQRQARRELQIGDACVRMPAG